MEPRVAQVGARDSPGTTFCTHGRERKTDVRLTPGLFGHAKLETTALYTRAATKTIREIMSPLDRITGKLKEGTEPPA